MFLVYLIGSVELIIAQDMGQGTVLVTADPTPLRQTDAEINCVLLSITTTYTTIALSGDA